MFGKLIVLAALGQYVIVDEPRPLPVPAPLIANPGYKSRPAPSVGGARDYGAPQGRRSKSERITADSDEARRFVAQANRKEGAREADRRPDDDGYPFLTVVGTEAERTAVFEALAREPGYNEIRDLVHVQGYDPESWAVKDIYPPGTPSILVQGPAEPDGTGKVLYRAGDFRAGPRPVVDALRRANPRYHPALDPGTASAAPCPVGFTQRNRPLVLATLGVVLVILALPKGDPRVRR